MSRVGLNGAMRGLPSLSLVAAVLFVATGFRPPPGDRTSCVYEADITACTRVIESGKLKGAALGKIYWHRASAFEREENYARAIADYTRAFQLDPKDDGTPDALGRIYVLLGKYALAETFYKHALALNKDSVLTPPILVSLATVSLSQQKQAQADTYFKRALAIYDAALRKDPADSTPVYGLADLYRAWGKNDKVEPHYRRLLAMQEEIDKNATPVASILESLAKICQALGKYADAESLYRRALSIWETSTGTRNDRDVARTLDGLAGLYRAQNDHAQAEALYQRALTLREASLGSSHTAVAETLNNLGKEYEAQGKQAEAQVLYARARSIWQAKFGPDHPNVVAGRGASARTKGAAKP